MNRLGFTIFIMLVWGLTRVHPQYYPDKHRGRTDRNLPNLLSEVPARAFGSYGRRWLAICAIAPALQSRLGDDSSSAHTTTESRSHLHNPHE